MEACAAVRKAVGDSMVLMSDPVAGYNRRQALWVGRRLEAVNYYRLEEPLSDYGIYGDQELCRVLEIPIAGTESPRRTIRHAAIHLAARRGYRAQ
jgi:L-alanine-DL-glutamate epimerase-like enolase superfamily enzyme